MQIERVVPKLSPDLEDIPITGRCNHAGQDALSLDQGVGYERRAVNHDFGLLLKCAQTLNDRAARIVWSRQQLV